MNFIERIKQFGWKRFIVIGLASVSVVATTALVHGFVSADRAVSPTVQATIPVPSSSPVIECPDRIEHDQNPAPIWIKGEVQKRISGEEEALIVTACFSSSSSPKVSASASASATASAKVVAAPASKKPTKPTATSTPTATPTPTVTASTPTPSPTPAPSQTSSACTSNANPTFTNQLIDPSKVTDITTPPNIAKPSEHLKTHSYVDTAAPGVPLYAPVDMELISGAHYVGGPYMFDFRVSCEVTLRLAHVIDPISKLKDALPAEPKNSSTSDEVKPPVAVKAGELIAYSGGPPHVLNSGLDFGVYNSTKPNRYAATQTSSIYTTAVCPFDYFPEAIRAAYRVKFDTDRNENMVADGASFCQ